MIGNFVILVGLWFISLYIVGRIWQKRERQAGSQFLKTALVFGLLSLGGIFAIILLMLVD